MPARTSPPLTRARVVATACSIADERGIGAVSMRSVAAALGVVPMALYKHVGSKNDLTAAMVDDLIAQYEAADSSEWHDQLRCRILSARRVLIAHPWGREAIESQTIRTAAVLGYQDSLAGACLQGGLSPDLTHHAMHALGHRIWGFSPEAFAETPTEQPSTAAADQQALFRTMKEVYPNIAAIVLSATDGDLTAIGAACDEQFEFEFTLDLLLDAIRRLHESGWTSKRSHGL